MITKTMSKYTSKQTPILEFILISSLFMVYPVFNFLRWSICSRPTSTTQMVLLSSWGKEKSWSLLENESWKLFIDWVAEFSPVRFYWIKQEMAQSLNGREQLQQLRKLLLIDRRLEGKGVGWTMLEINLMGLHSWKDWPQ